MMRAWQGVGHAAWLVALLGGCAAFLPRREVRQVDDRRPEQDAGVTASREPSSDPGRASLGFVLDSVLRARRLHSGRPAISLELGNDATVIDGDRLQVSVRTSQDAYLYLAFCSQHAKDPRYSGLTVFPEEGALRVRAYETKIAPDKAAEIVLDDKPGQEALYLIVSRIELSRSDAELTQVIASARQGSQSADCATSLRAPVAGPPGERKAKRVWSGSSQPRARRPAPPGAPSVARKRTSARPEDDPVVEIQRGGDIVWNNGTWMGVEADPEGIVILRYGLTHVAAP
jgi:hypothetical protein